ncbi:MAG: tetratricopeptide repeat protein [Paludibacteraceae bacterium]
MNRLKTLFLLLMLAVTGLPLRAVSLPEMEVEYNRIAERFTVRDKTLQRDLKTYLQQYPYTTYEDEIHFMAGVLQAEKSHWKQALKELEQVNHTSLTRSHQMEYQFYRGYCYLMQQEFQRAAVYFALLKKSDNPYTIKATYYYAYCQYKQGNYDKALPALLSLEGVTEYSKTVPYYLVQVYYAQHEYVEVETRAEKLLQTQPDSENNGELYRMLGEISYRRGDYRQAVDYLQAYEKAVRAKDVPLVRNDMYLLGMAELRLGSYSEAVNYLKQVKQEQDTISESTCLALGNAYVQLGQIEQAKLSYQAAAAFLLTPIVREEAMYNYALCTYRSSTALGESVHAFTDFLSQFPDSKYETEVYALLSEAFLRSRNYAAAMSILDSIPSPTPQMLQTKQYLRYQLGVDAFLQGKIEQSRDNMTDVINHTADSEQYTTEAYYWRAEANYRLHDYQAAGRDLERYYARSDARLSANYLESFYLGGYIRFALKDYEKARTQFIRYADNATTTSPTYADALNRIGDCYFNARNFSSAIAYYGQVIAQNATGSDYATFQRGYALGLQHKYADKINALQTLVARYPKSDYADDGLYEIARAQLQQEDERAAVASYERLLEQYPNSDLARKASLERAMLYRNMHKYEEAIAAYKRTIESYPATEEAYTALEGLEAICVETGNINDYLAYTKQLGRMNMQVATQDDSLSYAAAELQYMQGNYAKAAQTLTAYLSAYCAGGRHCTTAQYYAADAYYRLGKDEEALQNYRVLADMAGNPYIEEACMRVAGLSYEKQDYQTSLEYFYKMLALASNREHTDIARLGILRCSYYLGRHQSTIDIASQILSDEPTEEVKQEALYNRAKAYYAQQQWTQAIQDFALLAKEVRTAIGAEAKYSLANCYYQLSDLERSEKEIMEFTQMNTQQQYWLARALVLLSDINHRRGDDFQARQYLLSLRNNYRQQDDIAAMIEERLAALDEKEKEIVEETYED